MSSPKLTNSVVLKEIKPTELETLLYEFITNELELDVAGYDQNGPQWVWDLIYTFPEEEHYLYKQDQRELAKLKAHAWKDQIMNFLNENKFKTEIGSVSGVELQEANEDYYMKFQVVIMLPTTNFAKLHEAAASAGEEMFFSLNSYETLQDIPNVFLKEYSKYLVRVKPDALFSNPQINVSQTIRKNAIRFGVDPKTLLIMDDDTTGGIAIFTTNIPGIKRLINKSGGIIIEAKKKLEFKNSNNYIDPDTDKIYIYRADKNLFIDNQGRPKELTPEIQKRLKPLVNDINEYPLLQLKEAVSPRELYKVATDIEDACKIAIKKLKSAILIFSEQTSDGEGTEVVESLKKALVKIETAYKIVNKL